MRKAGLLIAAVMILQLCGCDGEMWISTGDNGWTSDFGKPWPPTQPAATVKGSNKNKTTAATDAQATKSEKLAIAIVTPETAQPTKNFSVNLTIENSTKAELKNILVEGLLPNGVKVADAAGPAVMHWKIPSLAAGESKIITTTLQASSEGIYSLPVRVTADGGQIASSTATIKIAKEQPKK